jgi:hypothetical protein
MHLNAKKGDEMKQALFYAGKGHKFAQRLLYYQDFPEFMEFYWRTPAGVRERWASA